MTTKAFPERRENDDSLIAFITESLTAENPTPLKERFRLSARDIEILHRRFVWQQSYQAIADAFHLSKERIRQVLLEIYTRFRHPANRPLWDLLHGTTGGIPPEPSTVPIGQMLLSTRARRALRLLRVKRLSDLIGKTRRDFTSDRRVHHSTIGEIERVIADYGLGFFPTAGTRRHDVITLIHRMATDTEQLRRG